MPPAKADTDRRSDVDSKALVIRLFFINILIVLREGNYHKKDITLLLIPILMGLIGVHGYCHLSFKSVTYKNK